MSLRTAAGELESALEGSVGEETEAYVTGVLETCEHFCEGVPSSPESHTLPQPGALRTIELRLADLADLEGGTSADHLHEAIDHLAEARDILANGLTDGRRLQP